MKPNISGRESR
jgi:hypothetical protein